MPLQCVESGEHMNQGKQKALGGLSAILDPCENWQEGRGTAVENIAAGQCGPGGQADQKEGILSIVCGFTGKAI